MSNLVSSPKNVVYVNGGQTYNVSAADDVINVNSNLGATEIVLPNIVNQGLDFYPKKFTVNDTGGVAGTNPITISAVGNIVNSGTSFILNRNNVSSEIVIVSKTEYLVNTDNGGSTGVFGSGVAGQLAYFSASTVLGSLTNAQVTVLIDPMVGDSGSGGLKGLVPAPAAGDAAANKYLKADGTWNAISFAGYLKADGTVPLTANWDVGAFEVTAQSLKVDGTGGNGHFHLRYQSSIPTGAANNSKLFSGATGELGWVVDSNAYAFYLDMTGNTASRTLTVPNASGTIALTTDIVNLGNSNLTSTDDARYFKLNGTTSSNFLKFRNSSDISILSLFGDKSIVFGNSGNPVSINFNIDASDATGDTWYRNSGGLMTRLGIGTSGQVLTVAAGLPSWATLTVNNLGNSNLTSADDARTFTLKSGGTATQNLQFLNSGGGNLLRLRGDNKISMLTSGGIFDINIGDASNTKTIYGFGNLYMTGATSAYETYLLGVGNVGVNRLSNGTFAQFVGGGNDPYINQKSSTYVLLSYDTSNNNIHYIDNRGFYRMMDSSGIVKVELGTQSSFFNFFARDTKIGGVHTTPSAKLEVQGNGSTSATTTALFQNSSSVATLSLRDDGVVQLGVNGATGIRFDPYGRTSFAMLQYLAAGSTYASLIYDSLNRQIFQIHSGGQVAASVPSGGTSILNLNSTINFEAVAVGDNFAYTSKNSLGNYTMYLRNISNVGTFELMNSAGVTQLYLAGGNGSYILNNLAIGVSSASAKFDVKGSGSTSATKTALFQNSSSLKSLEIFDSGGINFGSNTISGGEGYAFGVQNTVGSSTAFASGYLNIVNAYYAAAFGRENNITSYCFAAGYANTISATVSFAFGQWNTVSGSNSLVTGGSNSASGYNSFVYGQNSNVTSNYSMSGGLYATATGNNSVAIGLGYAPQAHNQLIAGGTASFIFSAKNASSVPNTGAMANYSFILGGLNHSVVSGATSSGIIGGEGNTINASVLRSVILGGSAITATASDTAYAININATTLITTPQVITTPATITVAANAGTVTRANRINNFTNSSAATMTITMSTTAALDGDLVQVRIYDFSAVTQTITWVNTENSSITVPATSNGSTTLPLTVGFQYNSATSKWRCIGSV